MVNQKDCLFCRMVAGQIPIKKVYEDSTAVGFLDINPRNPGHTLVIPKNHHETIFDMPDSEGSKFFSSMKKVAIQVKNGTKAHGISISQSNGSAAGQVVSHLHFHIIPRFLNEGPPALENMLSVKKMDEKSLDQITAAIRGSKLTPKRIEPVKERPPLKLSSQKTEKPKEEPKKVIDDDDDSDEFEEFNFSL